ncbi:MAG: response regulator [Desulfobacterales bacterium]|nr:response regulator [Desulfobacterales bacterium]MCP4159663.1 response regulator [Deltaproteobacteria bacterium]
MKIKFKIMVFVISLLIIMAMAVSSIVWGRLSTGIENQITELEKDLKTRADRKIKAGRNTLKIFIENNELSLFNQTRYITRNENIIRAVEFGKFDNVRGVLEDFCSTTSMTFAIVFDAKGQYIYSYPFDLKHTYSEELFKKSDLIKELKKRYIDEDSVEQSKPLSEFRKWSKYDFKNLNIDIKTDSNLVNLISAIIPNEYNDEAIGYIFCGNIGTNYNKTLKNFGNVTGFMSIAYSGKDAITSNGLGNEGENIILRSLNLTENDYLNYYNKDSKCHFTEKKFGGGIYNICTFAVQDIRGKKVGLFVTGELSSIIKNAVANVKHDGEKIFKEVFYSLVFTVLIFIISAILLLNYFTNQLSNSILHATKIASLIADGDLNHKMEISSTYELGILGKSMNIMISSLQELTLLNEHQLYIAQNKSMLDEAIRGEIDLLELSEKLVQFFREVFNAQIISIYTTKASTVNNEDTLYFTGGFGVNKEAYGAQVIKKGEGFVGDVVKNKKSVSISDVPLNFKKIKTLNTETLPSYVNIFPFIYYGRVNGIIEMASFESVSDEQMELLSHISEPIAIAINTAQDHTRINNLFERSKNLTENLKIQQEELKIKAKELERISMYKSEFLANMSHEIRTPMNGVIGMVDILKDTSLTKEQIDYVNSISKSSDALLNVINDILDFSKIEAGKLEIESIDFDIRSTVEDISEMLSFKTITKGIELICYIAPEIPDYLQGDPGRLRQILFNIVGNSVKFTQEGEVLISVEIKHQTDFEITLLFKIKDTGIGIAEDRIETLFDSFSQADSSTTRRFGGTGLGLTIAKQLTELMGGEIGVESKVGIGTTFWFTSKLVKSKTDKPVININYMNFKGKKFLIVDDNPTNRNVFRAYLQSWGCYTEEAASGEIALNLLSQKAEDSFFFDFAIIDMQMPYMDGETLGREIKANSAISNIKLIIATSIGTKGDPERMNEIGFSAYLNKPLKKNQLYNCIGEILSKDSIKNKKNKEIKTKAINENHADNEKLNILLAEDNKMNQKVAVNMLKKLNHNVTVANNGVEAIELFKNNQYDLILMDGQMPEMDGYEATQIIRNELKSDIPIIAVTAHAMKGDSEKFFKVGMNEYIPKPVKKKTLAEVIEKIFPKK